MYTEKELKKIRNKRTGRTRKIWGWVLIIVGLDTIIPLIIGIVILVRNKKQVKLWDQYEALINKNGNTSFDHLRFHMEKSDAELIEDLKVMVDNKFFIGPDCDIEAVIDTRRRYLVMTRDGEQLESFFRKEDREQPETSVKEEARLSYLDRIQEYIAKTNDEELRNTLYALEGSIRRIEEKIAADPQVALMDEVVKLEEYYLPQTYELIEKLFNYDGTPETLEKIKETLGVCAEAFRGIENRIKGEEDIDTVGDMAVLRNAFAREGLLEPDFKVQ